MLLFYFANFAENHPMNIPTKSGFIWPYSFGEKDQNVKFLDEFGCKMITIPHMTKGSG